MSPAQTATVRRMYEAERRQLIRQRAVVASILGAVLVPLFGIVDYFMYRQHFATLMTVRLFSCLASGIILLLLRWPFGRRNASALAVAVIIETGLAIAGVPVAVTGSNTPHYVSMCLLILSA